MRIKSMIGVSVFLMVCAVTCIFVNNTFAHIITKAQGSEVIKTKSTATTNSLPQTVLFQPVRTDSPRDTLETFLRLTKELEGALLAYQENQSHTNNKQFRFIADQLLQLIDLSLVPKASRREVGIDTLVFLLDILGRVDLPRMENIPDADTFEDEETLAKWRIPHTPIRIVRIEEGPREGEFLFSARTIVIAPRFYQRIQHLPLRTSLEIESWHDFTLQVHGPMIPARLVSTIPDSLKQSWLDTPIWKILIVVIVSMLATLFLVIWHRLIKLNVKEKRLSNTLRHILTPVAIIIVVLVLKPFFEIEVNVSGTFAQVVDFTSTLVIYLASVWLFWLVILTLTEWVILSPRIPDESLDANLLRLSVRVIGIVGGMVILAYGAQNIGIPVLGLLAGLGIGGLAVALALRPTLENLIGGAILYMDKPVRVGDFCTFGSHTGTVEKIGARSTQIRALDRTVIFVPNASFADMEIKNWARCDSMQILTTIGLRYETEPDQLRYVLAKLREMFHAHPRIQRDTVRVRFKDYGASSLDIEVRVYALTREWNDFYAIREDVLLRVNEIVGQSGTGFAFPSQTLYMGRDNGLDKELSDAAVQQVSSWRATGQLPFPRLTTHQIEELSGTLDYPPHGSPDADTSKDKATEAAEPLSAEPELEDEDNSEQQTEPEHK